MILRTILYIVNRIIYVNLSILAAAGAIILSILVFKFSYDITMYLFSNHYIDTSNIENMFSIAYLLICYFFYNYDYNISKKFW